VQVPSAIRPSLRSHDWLVIRQGPSKQLQFPHRSRHQAKQPPRIHLYLHHSPKNPHYHTTTRDKMSETTTPKPSSSVKLVLLGEAAVGKVCLPFRRLPLLSPPSANTSP
jgi:hypothetical protein